MTTKSVEAPNGTVKRRKPAAKKQTPSSGPGTGSNPGGDCSLGREVLGRTRLARGFPGAGLAAR